MEDAGRKSVTRCIWQLILLHLLLQSMFNLAFRAHHRMIEHWIARPFGGTHERAGWIVASDLPNLLACLTASVMAAWLFRRRAGRPLLPGEVVRVGNRAFMGFWAIIATVFLVVAIFQMLLPLVFLIAGLYKDPWGLVHAIGLLVVHCWTMRVGLRWGGRVGSPSAVTPAPEM